MKIRNETKIGALTALAVALLILGFNFLKGKNLFKRGHFLYAKYSDTKKLMPSNPVYLNGFTIGSVYEIEAGNAQVTDLIVTIKLNQDFKIPDNSVAQIESSPLGTPSITIIPGNSSIFLKQYDTILTRNSGGIFADLSTKLAPVADKLTETLTSLDSVLKNFNTIMNPNSKANLHSILENLNAATVSIVASTSSIQAMLNQQSGSLARSLQHVDSFSANLAANNAMITSTIQNLNTATTKLANADIEGAMNHLNASISSIDSIMYQLRSNNGTLGALINDKQLYNSLQSTVVSLHTLVDDLRVHPRRYVNISVFGRKDRGNYLESPLPQPKADTLRNESAPKDTVVIQALPGK